MVKEKKRWVPPFERVAAKLRARIAALQESGERSLGSEVSIAGETGVSRMTVRKAVNGLIAEGLVVRRPGVGLFVREAGASGLVYKALFGNLFWDPSMQAARAIRLAAEKVGARVEFFDAGGEEARLLQEIAALPESGAKGAVLFSSHGAAFDEAIAALARKNFPFVVIDEAVSLADVPSFVSDNHAGGALAAQALLEAGHRQLAFLGDFEADTVAARWEGFAAACAAAGVEPAKYDLCMSARLSDARANVVRALEMALGRTPAPTGLFCSCDAYARLVMRHLADAGKVVPGDLSLVGFDDDPIAEWTSPALTTVRQDFGRMGELAFDALVARVARTAAPSSVQVVPVELIRRASVTGIGS